MSRYNNRTLKRAGALLETLDPKSKEARRVGALVDAVVSEQERHVQKRTELLQRLREEMGKVVENDGAE